MRRRPPQGLDQLVTAAMRVFAEKGYRRAQMSDVARAMGVAPGTLYGYVAGKEALFHLVVDPPVSGNGRAPVPGLPVPTPPPGATLARLRERMTADSVLPALDAALRRARPADPRAEVEAVVTALYDRIAGAWQGIVVLETSALEWPELAQVFYADVRGRLLQKLERYIKRRMDAGVFQGVPSAAGAARFVLETVAWFAMHRHRDRHGGLDDRAARQTTLTLVTRAFVPARGRHARRKESRRR